MLSKYYNLRTEKDEFKKHLQNLFEELKDKKVLLYGAGEGFEDLDNKYSFKEKMNIVAIADMKFAKSNQTEFRGIKAISPEEIKNQEYDVILITNESYTKIVSYLEKDLCVEKDIKKIFEESFSQECANVNYLLKFSFDKTLPKLAKKLKGKKVVFYGAGVFLEAINKYFDIKDINAIGIADKKFEEAGIKETMSEFLGYKTYSPDEIKDLNPDYVVVTTKMYTNIIDSLYFDTLKNTKIKVVPLLKKPFMTLLKEIWG